ncbi:MAG: YrhB domain-containing protein [Thermoanaerobaculia bacterium]
MITHFDARKLAAVHIGEGRTARGGFVPVIVDERTLETPWGWVFFYESEEFLRTRDFAEALVGNGPIGVARADGKLYEIGSADSIGDALARIAEAERQRRLS